jgi:TonB family protein
MEPYAIHPAGVPQSAQGFSGHFKTGAKAHLHLPTEPKCGRAKPMNRKLTSLFLVSSLFLSGLFAAESSPAVKLAVAPKYPMLTLEGRIGGQVTVRVIIDRTGAVEDATVFKGHPMLREAAVEAARHWKFAASSAHKRMAILTFNFVVLPEDSEAGSQTIFLPPHGIEIRQKPAIPLIEDQDGQIRMDSQPIMKI